MAARLHHVVARILEAELPIALVQRVKLVEIVLDGSLVAPG